MTILKREIVGEILQKCWWNRSNCGKWANYRWRPSHECWLESLNSFCVSRSTAICVVEKEKEEAENKMFFIIIIEICKSNNKRKKRKLITSSALGPRRSQVIRVITWAGPVRPCTYNTYNNHQNTTTSVCRHWNCWRLSGWRILFLSKRRIEMWVNYCTSLSRALMSVRFFVCVSMETTVSLLASRRIVISPSALGSPAIRKTPVLFSCYVCVCARAYLFVCFRQRGTCERRITVSFNNVWYGKYGRI